MSNSKASTVARQNTFISRYSQKKSKPLSDESVKSILATVDQFYEKLTAVSEIKKSSVKKK